MATPREHRAAGRSLTTFLLNVIADKQTVTPKTKASEQSRITVDPTEIKAAIHGLRVNSWRSLFCLKHFLSNTQSLMRWFVACTGGAAVLWPMIVMVLGLPPRDQHAWPKVVIVTAATLGFATFIALASNSSHQDVMVAVATYTAVLVVFVGTQTTCTASV